MNGIGNFLRKYLDFTPPEKIITRAIVQTFEELLLVKITEEQVQIRNSVAFVSVDTIVKSEIVFRKKEILSRVKELLQKETLTDIS